MAAARKSKAKNSRKTGAAITRVKRAKSATASKVRPKPRSRADVEIERMNEEDLARALESIRKVARAGKRKQAWVLEALTKYARAYMSAREVEAFVRRHPSEDESRKSSKRR